MPIGYIHEGVEKRTMGIRVHEKERTALLFIATPRVGLDRVPSKRRAARVRRGL